MGSIDVAVAPFIAADIAHYEKTPGKALARAAHILQRLIERYVETVIEDFGCHSCHKATRSAFGECLRILQGIWKALTSRDLFTTPSSKDLSVTLDCVLQTIICYMTKAVTRVKRDRIYSKIVSSQTSLKVLYDDYDY